MLSLSHDPELAPYFATAAQICRMAESFCELTFALSMHSDIVNDDDSATVIHLTFIMPSLY
jgi:hypothetical protein